MSSHQWKNLLVLLPFWVLGSATFLAGQIIEFGYLREAVLRTVFYALSTLGILGGMMLSHGSDVSRKEAAVLFGLGTLGLGLGLALFAIGMCGESAGPH